MERGTLPGSVPRRCLARVQNSSLSPPSAAVKSGQNSLSKSEPFLPNHGSHKVCTLVFLDDVLLPADIRQPVMGPGSARPAHDVLCGPSPSLVAPLCALQSRAHTRTLLPRRVKDLPRHESLFLLYIIQYHLLYIYIYTCASVYIYYGR